MLRVHPTMRSQILGEHLPDDPPSFYETHVFICCNRRPDGHPRGDCAHKGSEQILDYMKRRVKELRLKHIRVNQSGCLDRCELGPCAVFYPEAIWYRLDSPAAVDVVIEKHLLQHKRAKELMLP